MFSIFSNSPKLSQISQLAKVDPLEMHRAVFTRNMSRIEELLSSEEMIYFDVLDCHHNTPLMLSVKLGFSEIAGFLLKKGSSINRVSDNRFTLIDEVLLSCRDNVVLREIYLIIQKSAWAKWLNNIEPAIIETFPNLPDFRMEILVKLEGNFLVNSLVSYFTPSETYRIWKKGNRMRLDFTIKGFSETMVAKRGNLSLVLLPTTREDYCVSKYKLLKLDHDKKTVKNMLDKLNKPAEAEIHAFVTKLLDTTSASASGGSGGDGDNNKHSGIENIKARTDSENIEFYIARDFFGWARTERLFGEWDCKLWHGAMKVQAKKVSKDGNPETSVSYSSYFSPSYCVFPAADSSSSKLTSSSSEDERNETTFDEGEGGEDGNEGSEGEVSLLPPSSLAEDGKSYVKEKTVLNRKVVSTLWLSDEIPLTFKDLMPIFEIIGLQDERMESFQSLMRKSENMFTDGCPVKISVPIFLGVSASVSLPAFELDDNIDDSIFDIPSTYAHR